MDDIGEEGGGGGVEPPTKFKKREGLTGLNFSREVAGKKGMTFFRRGEGAIVT